MITTTELAATILIWTLTVCGALFGSRAILRRRRQKDGNLQKPSRHC